MRAPLLLLVASTLICLAPFAGKAFNIDEPLFIWAAKNIQSKPFDPYGFNLIWYLTQEPMSKVTKNPPLASYYAALVGGIVGWRETALHLAFLIPAVAVVAGSYLLARGFCKQPLFAGLATLVTPVFLVSSTSVMSDTMMLAFWVWAVYCWIRGIEQNKHWMLLLSALFMAASALTKYFGMSLIPLLLAYTLMRKRSLGWWAAYFLIPVTILWGYELVTRSLYGEGLLLDSISYARYIRERKGGPFLAKSLAGLAYTGGSIIPVLFLAPMLWSRKIWYSGAACSVLLALLLSGMTYVGNFMMQDQGVTGWLVVFQCSLFAAGGVSLLALAFADLRRNRDAASSLLFLWTLGTFVFGTYFNWALNARSVLPMAPAAGILLMRQIEYQAGSKTRAEVLQTGVIRALIPAAIVALMVTWSDYRLANTARSAAAAIKEKFGSGSGQIWFQGHWGFQYYMESLGGKAIDVRSTVATPGDIVVTPKYNTNEFPIPPDQHRFLQAVELTAVPWLTTHSPPLGTSFYADVWGPLPFALGPVPKERYDVFLFTGRK